MKFQKKYIVFERDEGDFGRIIKTGSAPADVAFKQGKSHQFVLLDVFARDNIHKIQVDKWDDKGKPINPRIVDKTAEEIEAEKRRDSELNVLSDDEITIKKSQFEELVRRVERLENK